MPHVALRGQGAVAHGGHVLQEHRLAVVHADHQLAEADQVGMLQVVQRVIGHKVGTGGSSGVDFLRRALSLTFFPELYEVRTRIGQ